MLLMGKLTINGHVQVRKLLVPHYFDWAINSLFPLGHGFKFANCKRLPGRVHLRENPPG